MTLGGLAADLGHRLRRLGDGGDETDSARRPSRKRVARRGSWPGVVEGHQRELVLDLLLDATAGHHLLVGPDVVAVEGHELDEPDLVTLAVGEPSEVDDL